MKHLETDDLYNKTWAICEAAINHVIYDETAETGKEIIDTLDMLNPGHIGVDVFLEKTNEILEAVKNNPEDPVRELAHEFAAMSVAAPDSPDTKDKYWQLAALYGIDGADIFEGSEWGAKLVKTESPCDADDWQKLERYLGYAVNYETFLTASRVADEFDLSLMDLPEKPTCPF